jgi:hypothetical protein
MLEQSPLGGAAQSGAIPTEPSRIALDLKKVIDAWAALPDAVRAGIVAMVETVRQ